MISLISSLLQSILKLREPNRRSQARKKGSDQTKSYQVFFSQRSNAPLDLQFFLIDELYICGLNIIISIWSDYQVFPLAGPADGGQGGVDDDYTDDGNKTAVLLQCLGEEDDEEDDNDHSTDGTNNDHLLQREMQRKKSVKDEH